MNNFNSQQITSLLVEWGTGNQKALEYLRPLIALDGKASFAPANFRLFFSTGQINLRAKILRYRAEIF